MASVPFPLPLPTRRSPRLKGFDYTAAGAYFLTVCTRDKDCILAEIRDGRSIPSDIGQAVERSWHQISSHFPDVSCDEFIVMPNHVHGILFIHPPPEEMPHPPVGARHAVPAPPPQAESFGRPVAASLPTIIRSFKAAATKDVRSIARRSDFRLWQRGYYEHVIRHNKELDNIRRYIKDNPAKWESDGENPWRSLLRD